MKDPDIPVSGDPVRSTWGRQVVEKMRALTINPSSDILPEITSAGTLLRLRNQPAQVSQAASAYPALYDLSITGNAKFQIAGGGGANAVFEIGGQFLGIVSSDSPWAFNADITINGTVCVYLTFDLLTRKLWLTTTATLPNGTDTQEIYPLWYVGWDATLNAGAGGIDNGNILDLRHMMRESQLA
jgi:hypothetical protein